MKAADNLYKLINKLKIKASAELDKRVHDDIAMELSKSERTKSPAQKTNIGRIIMKSQITKLAAAACVILAVIFGIRIFIGGTSVALADVLQKVEQVQAFMYKIKTKTTGMPGGPVETIATVLISNEYGAKMVMDMNTVVNGVSQKTRQIMYMPSQEKKWYTIMPEQKQYVTMEFDETIGERMKKQSNDPRELLRMIVNFKCTDIGKSVIDGVEVEGFQTTDPAIMSGMMEDVNVILWVDRKTELPVRVEMHNKMNEQMQMDMELYDFQWDVQVNADEFKPVIPQDYTSPLPNYKMPTASEDSAIDGLRSCEQILGRYPKKIDYMNLMNEIGSGFRSIEDSNNPQALKLREILGERLGLQGNMKEQMSKLPVAEKAKKMMEFTKTMTEFMMEMLKPGIFYMTLVGEKKEPVYYGDIVGPADADKVLLRWKLSDTEYRVIYGNLAAETVSAERLAELESKIPKQ
jgi:outer membrane lipoprotein-sorting protein